MTDAEAAELVTLCEHGCTAGRCSYCDAVAAERARCLAIFRRWGFQQSGKPYCRMAEAQAAMENGVALEKLEEQLAAARGRPA